MGSHADTCNRIPSSTDVYTHVHTLMYTHTHSREILRENKLKGKEIIKKISFYNF